MKTDRLVTLILLLLTAALLLLPLVSWIASLAGTDVRNLLSGEGLRWMFLHGGSLPFGYLTSLTIITVITIGAYSYVGLPEARYTTTSFRLTLLLATLFDILLLLALFHPRSPLISLTGRLFPSPFFYGFPFALCIGLLLTSLFYGILARRLTTASALVTFMTTGLQRYPRIIILVMIATALYHTLQYIL